MAKEQQSDIDLGITRFEYGDTERPQRAVLTVSTSKYYNGGLISNATVYWVGDHSRQNMMCLGDPSGGDYTNRLKVSARTVKATQKAIDTQHAEVFTAEAIARLTQAAKDHYARFVRAGIDGFKNTYAANVEVAG